MSKPLRKLTKNNIAGLDHIYKRSMVVYNKIKVSESYKPKFKSIKLVLGATDVDEIEVRGPAHIVKEFLDIVESKHALTKSFKTLIRAIKQYSREDQRRYIELKEQNSTSYA